MFGLAPVEAAACGRPVIVSSAVPALQEAIRQGSVTGSVYDWSDTAGLTAALRSCLHVGIQERNRSYVLANFGELEIGRRLVTAYRSLQ